MRNPFKRIKNPFKKKGSVPKPLDPNMLARGRTLIAKNAKGENIPVIVDKVTGNIHNPKCYELNGQYLISMLEFYHQLEGTTPSDEEQSEWDEIQVLAVEPIKGNMQ